MSTGARKCTPRLCSLFSKVGWSSAGCRWRSCSIILVYWPQILRRHMRRSYRSCDLHLPSILVQRCVSSHTTLAGTSVDRSRQFSATEVNGLRDQLKKVEGTMKDGNFVGPDGAPLAGQDELKALMDRCWKWTEIVLERWVSNFTCKCRVSLTHQQRRKD